MRGERQRIKGGCKGGMLNGESKGGQELARYRQRGSGKDHQVE